MINKNKESISQEASVTNSAETSFEDRLRRLDAQKLAELSDELSEKLKTMRENAAEKLERFKPECLAEWSAFAVEMFENGEFRFQKQGSADKRYSEITVSHGYSGAYADGEAKKIWSVKLSPFGSPAAQFDFDFEKKDEAREYFRTVGALASDRSFSAAVCSLAKTLDDEYSEVLDKRNFICAEIERRNELNRRKELNEKRAERRKKNEDRLKKKKPEDAVYVLRLRDGDPDAEFLWRNRPVKLGTKDDYAAVARISQLKTLDGKWVNK